MGDRIFCFAKLKFAWVAAATPRVWSHDATMTRFIGLSAESRTASITRVSRRSAVAALAAALIAIAAPALAQKAPSAERALQKPRVHVVSFGLWADNDLFRREATAAADVLADYFGRSGQLMARANTKNRSAARIPDLRDTLHGLASTMDRNEDVLVLFLTSHGAQDGLGVKLFDSDRVFPLSPERLGGMLRVAAIKHRVIIISACYSGVFSEEIADDHTLVITAADKDHSSFGCNDDNPGTYTYFGEAFFGQSLKPGVLLDDAFRDAKARVGTREKAEKLEGSNPQMKGGAAVRRQLARVQSFN
jgi:Peptidase C13 family